MNKQIENTKKYLIVKLTEFYKQNPNPSLSEIKDATSKSWRVSSDRVKMVDYIISLNDKDKPVGIYTIKNVINTGVKSGNSTRKNFILDEVKATDLLSDLIGEKLKNSFAKGNKNPVNYGEMYINLI